PTRPKRGLRQQATTPYLHTAQNLKDLSTSRQPLIHPLPIRSLQLNVEAIDTARSKNTRASLPSAALKHTYTRSHLYTRSGLLYRPSLYPRPGLILAVT